jgi:hypothetical protein
MLEPLRDSQLADATTVFNIAQRLGGSLGVGVIGSLLAARAQHVGPIVAFHDIGLVLTAIAVVATVAAAWLAPIRQPDPAVTQPVGSESHPEHTDAPVRHHHPVRSNGRVPS